MQFARVTLLPSGGTSVLTLIALVMLGANPAEPAAPKAPAVPEAKLPTTPDAKGSPPHEPSPKAEESATKPLSPPPLEVARPPEENQGAAPKDRASAASKGDGGTAETPATPLSISKKGLCGELVKSGKELTLARKKLDDERRTLEADRMALEKLRAEIADARVQLRAETERLEGLLTKRAEGGGGEGERSGSSERSRQPAPNLKPQDLDGLAKTMRSMKPEAAAALLMKSEPMLGAGVLRRMKPADAGAILDRVKPDFAADLLALMATIPASPPSKAGRL